MSTPVRLRLSRARGFNLRAASHALNGLPAVRVSRPSLFGNPFVVGRDGTAEQCVDFFKLMIGGYVALTTKVDPDYQIKAQRAIVANLDALRGNNLACWCRLGSPCHGDVLLRLANNPKCEAA